MDATETLRQATERLYARHTFGIKLGLHVEQDLLRRLGNPERAFIAVHVAGTNGKGSVCAYVDSMLRELGFRTGFYSSPHLVRFNERFRVAGAIASDEDLAALVPVVEGAAEETARALGQEPTFFECSTAMAFELFRRKAVDVGVIEVGMGGRLDATNVLDPAVSVITRISLEHTAYLGKDVPTIAGEKAGIIKPEKPVVCGAMDELALEVIRRTAAERASALCVAPEHVNVRLVTADLAGQVIHVESAARAYGAVRLRLLGPHQLENVAVAVAAVEVLADRLALPLPESVVRGGLEKAEWPGRCQVLCRKPPVILDGAHNPGAAEALARTLKQLLKKRPLALVTGMCADKDLAATLRAFGPMVRRLWAVPIRTERGLPAARVAAAAGAMGWGAKESELTDAVREAREWAAAEGGAVCVTGSLFLVGEVLERRAELGLQAG